MSNIESEGIDVKLTLNSVNTKVTEFESLISDMSLSVANTNEQFSDLGSVTPFGNSISKYSSLATSYVNSYTGKVLSKTNLISSKISSLYSGIEGTYSKYNNLKNNYKGLFNKHVVDVSENRSTSELKKPLHDEARDLAETLNVDLPRTENNDKQYVKFKGGNNYLDFNGTIDSDNRNLQAAEGWLTLNNKSDKYGYFTNGNKTFIVSLNDISPYQYISSYDALYDVLKKEKISKAESIINDTKIQYSEAVTKKEISEDLKKNNDDIYLNAVYPEQVGTRNQGIKNDSVYNNVQAVVYDLTSDEDVFNAGIKQANTMLLCYQQPDNISYTASAQFDEVSTRGTQQPFQFYQSAQSMSLSFDLKWHIDEIRTLMSDTNKQYTIQDIAQIAEDFTRPWKKGNSIEPKLCKVILPSIQHIGYITQAQISYSGDMSGDYSTGGGVLSDNKTYRDVTNYFYSQLEISFSMIIIKDITLRQKTVDKKEMLINTRSVSSSETITDKMQTEDIVKENSTSQDSITTTVKEVINGKQSPSEEIFSSVNSESILARDDQINISSIAEELYNQANDAGYLFEEGEDGISQYLDFDSGYIFSAKGMPEGFYKDPYDNITYSKNGENPIPVDIVDGYLSYEDNEGISHRVKYN